MIHVNNKSLIFNILKAEVGVSALTCGDIISIRTNHDLSFHYTLQHICNIFYNHISVISPLYQEYFKTFEHMLSYVSYYELDLIAFIIFNNTFTDVDDTSFYKNLLCPHCQQYFKKDIELNDYITPKNILIWDKNKPYYQYLFKHDIIKNNLTINVHYYIPNLKTFFTRIMGIDKYTIMDNIKEYHSLLDELTELTLHISHIDVKYSSQTYSINQPNEIYDFLEKLPSDIYNDILHYYKKEILKYKPKFQIEDIICPACGQSFDLKLYPLFELIGNIDIDKHETKIASAIDNLFNLYLGLYYSSDYHYISLSDFLNTPYPVYYRFSDKLIEKYTEYKKKMKLEYEKQNRKLK